MALAVSDVGCGCEPSALGDGMEQGVEIGGQPLVVYDGVCGLCHGFVQTLLRVDSANVLRFAPLQGETADACRVKFPEFPADLDSVVFLYQERLFVRSRAVSEIASVLGWPWRAVRLLGWAPLFISDRVYDAVACRRYRVFGKLDGCRLPSAEQASLFLP